jgi:3-keto-L-gulonate-6-phosphate decarboxylase
MADRKLYDSSAVMIEALFIAGCTLASVVGATQVCSKTSELTIGHGLS